MALPNLIVGTTSFLEAAVALIRSLFVVPVIKVFASDGLAVGRSFWVWLCICWLWNV